MPAYVSLLRGINVGGHRKVPMTELRALYGELGFNNVATYIQSGNVVHTCPTANANAMAMRITDAIEAYFGFPVPVMVRTAAEIADVLKKNPLLSDATTDPTKHLVAFLSEAPPQSALALVEGAKVGADRCAFAKRHAYLYCKSGYAKTKLKHTWLEKTLGVNITVRNWKTVTVLGEMAANP